MLCLSLSPSHDNVRGTSLFPAFLLFLLLCSLPSEAPYRAPEAKHHGGGGGVGGVPFWKTGL